MADDIKGGLDDALSQWIKQLESSTTDMSIIDKADISNAGAKVFEKHLRAETNAKHRSTHNDETWGHAADHIGRYQPKDGAEGIRLGSYIVGWENAYHAMNMLRINDGTSKYAGDHFITNLQHDPAVRREILEAEKAEWEKIKRRNKEKGAV